MIRQMHGMHTKLILKIKSNKSNLLSYRGYFNDTYDKFDDGGGVSSSIFTESGNEVMQEVNGYIFVSIYIMI